MVRSIVRNFWENGRVQISAKSDYAIRALLNLAASCLEPAESYVEVGSFYGASLIGAMRGNTGRSRRRAAAT